jgi:hypothetical protein
LVHAKALQEVKEMMLIERSIAQRKATGYMEGEDLLFTPGGCGGGTALHTWIAGAFQPRPDKAKRYGLSWLDKNASPIWGWVADSTMGDTRDPVKITAIRNDKLKAWSWAATPTWKAAWYPKKKEPKGGMAGSSLPFAA